MTSYLQGDLFEDQMKIVVIFLCILKQQFGMVLLELMAEIYMHIKVIISKKIQNIINLTKCKTEDIFL